MAKRGRRAPGAGCGRRAEPRLDNTSTASRSLSWERSINAWQTPNYVSRPGRDGAAPREPRTRYFCSFTIY
ncbi:unnamed protein product, partial [Brenthis ino]